MLAAFDSIDFDDAVSEEEYGVSDDSCSEDDDEEEEDESRADA